MTTLREWWRSQIEAHGIVGLIGTVLVLAMIVWALSGRLHLAKPSPPDCDIIWANDGRPRTEWQFYRAGTNISFEYGLHADGTLRWRRRGHD